MNLLRTLNLRHGAGISFTGMATTGLMYLLQGGSTPLVIMGELFLLLGLLCIIIDTQRRGDHFMRESSRQSLELEKTRDYLIRANEHLVALHSFSRRIASCSTIHDLCTTSTTALVNSFSYDSSIFLVWHKDHDDFLGVAASGATPGLEDIRTELGKNRHFLESLLSSGKTIMVRAFDGMDSSVDPKLRSVLQFFGLYSCVLSPLIHEDHVLGILLAGYQSAQIMDTQDARIIESVVNTATDRMAKGQLESIDERDEIVFNSVSNLAGDALARVIMFTGMEQQIELRAEQLKRTHEQLTQTREILIQVEKLSSLGRMAAGVIHEINDPLNFLVNILPDLRRDIDGLAKVRSLTMGGGLDQETTRKLDFINEQYDLDSHLSEMDFVFDRASETLSKSSKIAQGLGVFAQGGGKSATKRQNLLDIARSTLDLIPRKVKGFVSITVDSEQDAVWDVNADRFSQVCMNLTMNAIDAMGGKGNLTIEGESNNGTAVIRFRDSGPGIPEAIQKKIFDPFFTTKPAGKSTGLGLTICSEIVKEFGGRIAVESTLGQGTCFSIVFTEEQRKAFAATQET